MTKTATKRPAKKDVAGNAMDDVLKRMLAMPPAPFTAPKDKGVAPVAKRGQGKR